jgi:hypothetical protein
MNRAAVLVQRLVEGQAIAKRVNKQTGEREFLLRWQGTAGDVHEVWYPESVIKLED